MKNRYLVKISFDIFTVEIYRSFLLNLDILKALNDTNGAKATKTKTSSRFEIS